MWRQNKFPENPDSDQSISEEELEDFDNGELGGHCVSLGGNTEKEERLQIQSRLEMLRGTNELHCGREVGYLSEERLAGSSLEDEIEVPDSPDEDDITRSARQVISPTCVSDEEPVSGNKAQHDAVYKTTGVPKESDTLIDLNGNALHSSHSCYLKTTKLSKVVKGRATRKFSFHFQSCKEMPSKACEIPKTSELIDNGRVGHSIPKLLEDSHAKIRNESKVAPVEVEGSVHSHIEHLMTDVLDGLQDNINVLKGNSKMVAVKRHASQLELRAEESEELPESMDRRSSTDDEANYQNVVFSIPEMKRQSIADRFQEALDARSLVDEGAVATEVKPSGSGLFAKLQDVMQREKERDKHFLNKLKNGVKPDNEPPYIDVKIVSKYFDAKLIVCQCFVDKFWPDNHQKVIDKEQKRTVIFKPKVCGDVDLEVGSLIRIHAPWKEVEAIGNDENIILCTFFSQVFA